MTQESLWGQIKSEWKSAQDQGIVPKTLAKPESKPQPQRVEKIVAKRKVARKK